MIASFLPSMWVAPRVVRKAIVGSIGGLLCLSAATSAWADCSVDYCTSVYVDEIYVESGANSWIKTSGTETNLSVCTPDSGVFLWLDGSAPQKKEVLAVLMTAYSLEKPVTVRVTNGARGCAIAYVLLDR